MNTHGILNDADLPSPLPRRAAPSPDEDLLSVLRRSASCMGYPDLRWLLRPAEGKWILEAKEIPLLSAKGEYRILERLLQLSREELHSHTLHRFAPLLEAGEGLQQSSGQETIPVGLPQLSPKTRKTYFLPATFIRVCPLCLQESKPYDRLYWRIQLLFHCPLHKVRLLEKCPSCETPIAANRPSPYSCPRCRKGDYRAVDSVPLPIENPFYLGERLLLEAFGIAPPANEVTSGPMAGSPLSALSGVSYLYLLETITSQLDRIFSHQELSLLMRMLYASSPEDSPLLANLFEAKSGVVFFLFHWLFLAWPINFSAFLDAWYSLSTPPFTGEHPKGVFLSSRSLFFDQFEPDAYAWLRQTYYDYHRQFHQDPDRIDHFRNSINLLARSMRPPQKRAETRRIGNDEDRLYIPPRLLAPVVPYPWESLGSALSRAAKKMDHPYPEQLLYHPYFSPRPMSLSELASEFAEGEVPLPGYASNKMLAHLLQIPEEDIPRLTGSDLIGSLGLPRYNFSSRYDWLSEHDLQRWLLPYHHDTTRVCPYCVEEQEGYDRVFWDLQGVLCCPHHRARLLEKCPACLQAIPAVRPRTNHCPFCSRATYKLSANRIPKNSALVAGTNLLLTKLGIPVAGAASTSQFFGQSPLLDEKPPIYFALLIELTLEIGSYYAFSREQLLQLCHMLGERTISPVQESGDPYAIDAGVMLFHTLFSHWPQRFFAFLDMLYQKALAPARAPHDVYARLRWLLTNNWTFITPHWLFVAFEEHVQQYRSRAQRVFSLGGQSGGNFSTHPDTTSS